ncbi:MAG: DUF1080 domain-containing protein [Bacteroidetes bacterium]|jgi:cytochrome c|nr:DUF1080 domain-containing protein [Bacteroidota bacterium]
MFNYFKTILPTCLIVFSFFLIGCGDSEKESSIDRPHSPWVFRSVLDQTPRMITMALHDNMWVAYSAKNGSLSKAWKGGVNFDGAVYTTVHGPQPSTIGDFWTINEYTEPWSVVQNGNVEKPKVQYRGHRFDNSHAILNYDLMLEDGTVIKVSESPEYVENPSKLAGLDRTFETSNVPEGAQVVLDINVNSISMVQSIKTDGEWTVEKTEEREEKGLNAIDAFGKLILKSNGSTAFTTTFTKQPLLENPNKVVGAEEEELPLGYRLIARTDCKTCHNTYAKTVGPAYIDVAKKYENNPANVAMLVGKVKNGGKGVWGEAPMTPHHDMDEGDITIMVQYIMDLDKEEEEAVASIPEGNAPEATDFESSKEGIADNEMFPGGLLSIYSHDYPLSKLADVNSDQTPEFEGIVPQVNLLSGDLVDLADHSAIHIEGYLKIPTNNNYVFRLASDDGSKLWIDDMEVIDHDGLHGAGPKDGEMALAEGYHSFKIEFFQGAGGKSLEFFWRPYGTSEFTYVPATVIVHNQNDRPDGAVTMGGETQIPGDGFPVTEVHPSYDLAQARPDDFLPKVGGLDFLSDGRAVVSTWDAAGAVYVVNGSDSGDPSKMSHQKIAEGLAEPLGLKVVDDEIYVLQKQELTKLIDNDGDGITDEYRTICNSWTTTANFHEFAFGLVYKDGYFYGNTAIAILPGGASANPQAPDRGKTFKISKETGELTFVAQGLRTPNGIGLGVDNEIFVADNQGDWLPSCKILHITQDAFFNSYAVDPVGMKDVPVKQPVVWLPQDEIGNSPTTPLALNDGPYAGQMIHGEVTNGGVKRVFVEKVDGEYQGCVFRFIQGLEAGVNRMAWGPDGSLYVGGVGSSGNWQHYGTLWYGLQKLTYNSESTFEMLAVRVKSNGMEIEFTEALPDGLGWNPEDYEVSQWWYKPTIEYGGPKMDEERLTVRSASVSNDRKKVFLKMDGMKERHVVYVRLPSKWMSDKGNEMWTTEAWYTLNSIPQNNNGTVVDAPQPTPHNALSEAEKAAGWKLLFDGETTNGWRNFKKQTIGSSWKVMDEALTLDVVKKADGHWQAEDGGDIITDDEYENYEFKLEWKIQPCGNSGIIYNVVESDDYDYAWNTGPEMQVLDNTCHPDAKIPTHRASDLYDMIECKYVAVRPAGEWNEIRLISNNGHVEHWLNGRKVVEFQMHTPEWNEMIKNSKFRDMKGFGQAKKGRISLQDHGDRVWYRNIKIREL